MRSRVLSTLGAILFVLGISPAASATSRTTTQFCAEVGPLTNASLTTNGIYLTGYVGNNLSQVGLSYVATHGHGGLYSISLTARIGSFAGQVIGSPQTAIINVGDDQVGSKSTAVFFDFGGAPVTPGDTITFTQSFEDLGAGGGQLGFNRGGGNCPGVFETQGTNPPLDTVIRNSAAIVTNELNLTSACIPSDTVMCVDDQPGDKRFKVTTTFHSSQGTGFSGNGQEIPLSTLGVNHGGLFWFFGPDNPEMLFKMVNGCSLNNHFWVFISAGTNVAFTVTVFDTVLGDSVSYSNPDLMAALPVQDTGTLTCP